MQEFYFSGTIERIIFENASNFFRILLLEIDETDSDFEDYEIIVTGTMGDVMEGEDYTFWGQLTNHPKYGEQLQMTRYERSKPSASGLIKYFASDNFKGIGKKTAERIVEIYGEDPIDKILEDPSKLEQISNLSKVNRSLRCKVKNQLWNRTNLVQTFQLWTHTKSCLTNFQPI